SANQSCLSKELESQTGEAPLMRRARLLVLCALALAFAAPTFSQTPSSVVVMYPPPATVFLTPDHFAMILDETRKLVLVDDLGRAIPPSSWSVSDPGVARIASDGTITAIGNGTTAITGAYEN